MTLIRATLRGLAVTALMNATTLAGNRVYSPRAWNIGPELLPALEVFTPADDKQSQGSVTAPAFTTTITLVIIGTVKTLASDEAAPATVQTQGEQLEEQVLKAIINDYALTKELQQYPYVNTKTEISAEGDYIFYKFVTTIGLETYEPPDNFAPVVANAINEVDLTLAKADGTPLQVPDGHGGQRPLGETIVVPQ